jgi:type II secretory pathway component PulM
MSVRRERLALGIGVSAILLAFAYAIFAQPLGYHIEWAGVTMLAALGIALGLMAFVLTSGSGD